MYVMPNVLRTWQTGFFQRTESEKSSFNDINNTRYGNTSYFRPIQAYICKQNNFFCVKSYISVLGRDNFLTFLTNCASNIKILQYLFVHTWIRRGISIDTANTCSHTKKWEKKNGFPENSNIIMLSRQCWVHPKQKLTMQTHVKTFMNNIC